MKTIKAAMKNKKKILWAALAVIVIYQITSRVFFINIGVYHSDKYEYTLTDAKSGKPISNVIVDAIWYYRRPRYFTNSHIVGVAKIIESESDKNGHVVIPAWGPAFTFLSYIPKYAPSIYFYKPGYTFVAREYGGYSYFDYRRDQLTRTTAEPSLKMPPIENKKELVKNVKELSSALSYFDLAARQCLWKQTPKLFAALLKQKQEFKNFHLEWPNDSILEAMYRIIPEYRPPNCVPPEEFENRVKYEKPKIVLPSSHSNTVVPLTVMQKKSTKK